MDPMEKAAGWTKHEPLRIELEDVKRLDARPGDVLVIRLAEQHAVPEVTAMASRWLETNLPGVRVMVLPFEADVELVRPS